MVPWWNLISRKCSVYLSMTGVFLVSGEIFTFSCIFESTTSLFHHHSTMTASDNDSEIKSWFRLGIFTKEDLHAIVEALEAMEEVMNE